MQIGVETSKAVDQRRVFVIDDDEITRAALQFMLHDEIETHELTNPEEAYEKGRLAPASCRAAWRFLPETAGHGVDRRDRGQIFRSSHSHRHEKSDEATRWKA